MSLTLRSGLAFAVFCASGLCPQASVFPQQESGGAIETQPAVLTVPGSADFEVKRVPERALGSAKGNSRVDTKLQVQ